MPTTDLERTLSGYFGLEDAERRLRELGISKICVSTLRNYVDAGKLRAIRVAGRRLILKTDLERLAAERGGTAKAF